jgi:hypothetical protein
MRIPPEIAPVDPPGGMQHVVMIIPIDSQENEAQDVAKKNGPKRHQLRRVRHLQLPYHDRDDDGENAVAECLEPVLTRACGPSATATALQSQKWRPHRIDWNKRRAGLLIE